MKRVVLGLFLLVWTGVTSSAQTPSTLPVSISDNVALQFSAAAAPSATGASAKHSSDWSAHAGKFSSAMVGAESSPVLVSSLPEPVASPPTPLFGRSSRDTRWELALGLDFLWFRSAIFNAGAIGTKTSVAYFRSDWIGIEGVASTAFAPTIYANEHIKLLTYGAGPKIVWRRPQWDPWMHAIFGGAHEFPKTSAGSKNGLGVELGGGADYYFAQKFAGRLEGNYILTPA
jgi:hypothetical protein